MALNSERLNPFSKISVQHKVVTLTLVSALILTSSTPQQTPPLPGAIMGNDAIRSTAQQPDSAARS